MTREEGKINKNTERNSGHIGFRVWELAERQRGKGLNFKILTGSELGGAEGMVMVISNNDIVVSSGSLAQMPLEHQELMTDKNAALVLTRTDCVHLKSSGSGVKKELGVSFIFLEEVRMMFVGQR